MPGNMTTSVNEVKQFHVKPFPLGWSPDDLARLRQLRVEEGRPTHEIAAIMGRSHLAVRLKLTRLGWVAPYRKRRAS